MSQRRVHRQVEAILEGNGLQWSDRDDTIVLRFASAIVRIDLAGWGAQTLIQIRSILLSGLACDASYNLLSEVNRLNSDTLFGKWVYYEDEGILALEYDLLGDHLQEAELMTALAAIARLADHHDDILQAKLGGQKGTDHADSGVEILTSPVLKTPVRDEPVFFQPGATS